MRNSSLQRALRRFSVSTSVSLAASFGVLLGAGCKTAPDDSVITRIESLRSAATPESSDVPQPALLGAAPGLYFSAPPPTPAGALDRSQFPETERGASSAFCQQVERQARETNAGLPKDLDSDTRAVRVVAYGCDVILEYAMLDIRSDQVLEDGMSAMRSQVAQKLCTDTAAHGVLDHGGSFTSVYRDERSALIDQFTISAEDCSALQKRNTRPERVGL